MSTCDYIKLVEAHYFANQNSGMECLSNNLQPNKQKHCAFVMAGILCASVILVNLFCQAECAAFSEGSDADCGRGTANM